MSVNAFIFHKIIHVVSQNVALCMIVNLNCFHDLHTETLRRKEIMCVAGCHGITVLIYICLHCALLSAQQPLWARYFRSDFMLIPNGPRISVPNRFDILIKIMLGVPNWWPEFLKVPLGTCFLVPHRLSIRNCNLKRIANTLPSLSAVVLNLPCSQPQFCMAMERLWGFRVFPAEWALLKVLLRQHIFLGWHGILIRWRTLICPGRMAFPSAADSAFLLVLTWKSAQVIAVRMYQYEREYKGFHGGLMVQTKC